MILTGPEIEKQMKAKRIHIRPFILAHLGPNSYDVRLAPVLRAYACAQGKVLDMRAPAPTYDIEIPEQGYILEPGTLYLGATMETACSSHYIPKLDGRSSVGRLGISIHITAGFGDVGWGYERRAVGYPKRKQLICLYPTWTLEITVIHPVRVYAGVRVGQVYFTQPEGERKLYTGKYSRQKLPEASRLHEDKP